MCPLADMPAARPLPGAEAPIGPMGTSHRVKFRPRGSSPPRRFPPHGGRGFVAPRSQTRVRRVSRSPGPDARGRPKTVRSTGPSQWRSPRRVHTLRSLPFADSRTASLRPLPPCRYRPAEAGRRSDSVMLRSAEADPHVTEHEVPSRRRSDAGQPRTTPDGRSRTGARRGPGDQTRAGVGPPRTLHPDPRATSEEASLVLPRPEPRSVARGCIASTEAGGMRVRRIVTERFGFEALLRRRSSLSSGHRCR